MPVFCHCREARGLGGAPETLRHALQTTAQAHGLDATNPATHDTLLDAYYADLRKPECMPLACGGCHRSLLKHILEKDLAHVHDL